MKNVIGFRSSGIVALSLKTGQAHDLTREGTRLSPWMLVKHDSASITPSHNGLVGGMP